MKCLLVFQYLAEERSPVEGFYVMFKPRDSKNYKQHTILGAVVSKYTLQSLLPDTVYNIRMRSFNTAGESGYGNTVEKKTLCKFTVHKT